MNFVFNPKPQAFVEIARASEYFPVHRIYCVGRNYAAHAVEMGHDPEREAPFFFQKNPDNLLLDGAFTYPPLSDDVHHEIELVVGLKSGGRTGKTSITIHSGLLPVSLKDFNSFSLLESFFNLASDFVFGISSWSRKISESKSRSLNKFWTDSAPIPAANSSPHCSNDS